jgi:hypothetical protein
MTYLYSLRGQCAVFARDLRRSKSLQEVQNLVERLKGLHTGCLTLGLHYAAELVIQLRQDETDIERVEQALIEIELAISSQEERVKARHSLASGVAIKRGAMGGAPA